MNSIVGTPYWFGEQYRKIHIEKEDVTVISVKDIHKKNIFAYYNQKDPDV